MKFVYIIKTLYLTGSDFPKIHIAAMKGEIMMKSGCVSFIEGIPNMINEMEKDEK